MSELLRRERRDRGGIALLVVIASVMFLTVLVTDISFGSRTRFLTAVHQRDEAQAEGLAVTGVNVYRLLLMANKQISDNQQICSLLTAMSIPCQDALVKMVPFVNTGLMRMLFVADEGDLEDEDVEAYARTGQVSDEVAEQSRDESSTRFDRKNFLDFPGDFMAEVQGEDCRMNVNLFASVSSESDIRENAIAKQVHALLSGEENERWLRDRNLDAWDLIGNLADWVDSDSTVASGKGGYEDNFYNRLDSPYLAKNAKFDTWQEIRLVEGWQGEVFDRFAPQLTIYGSGKINVNCADDTVLEALLRGSITPTPNDTHLDQYLSMMKEHTALQPFQKAQEFYDYFAEELGLTVDPDLKSVIDVKTRVYTIRSLGQVGDATAQVTAVLDQSSSDAGKVVYWRVD